MKSNFGLNVIVAINKFNTDTEKEIKFLVERLEEKQVPCSLVEGWAKGGDGATDIAEKLVELTKKEENFKFTYNLEDSIKEKIEKVAKNIYRAKEVIYTDEANKNIEKIENLGYGNLPICIAKTQYSLSDDPKNLECLEDYSITIRDVDLKAGAGFVVALAGNIMTMPGLPKVPAAESIDIDDDGNIVGIF